jgi:hypothetical protein
MRFNSFAVSISAPAGLISFSGSMHDRPLWLTGIILETRRSIPLQKAVQPGAVIPAYDMRLLWISVNMHLSGRSLALTV